MIIDQPNPNEYIRIPNLHRRRRRLKTESESMGTPADKDIKELGIQNLMI